MHCDVDNVDNVGNLYNTYNKGFLLIKSVFTQLGPFCISRFLEFELFVSIQVNFGESFTAWIHVKALRVFVESVLR